MIYGVVVALIVAAFVSGTVYGRTVEARSLAAFLKIRSIATTDAGKLYAAVVLDIKTTTSSILARIRKAL